jgi:hypothetical protein
MGPNFFPNDEQGREDAVHQSDGWKFGRRDGSLFVGTTASDSVRLVTRRLGVAMTRTKTRSTLIVLVIGLITGSTTGK